MKIPIAKTVFEQAELDAILEPLRNGWVVQGPLVKDFEEKWCSFTGAPFAIATSSCTTALHLSLAAMGIGPGDEVIVPAFTWVASANAVESLGARPIFADISLSTFNIEPSGIPSLLSAQTKAIMPVHLFGLSASMDEVIGIAKKKNLLTIEDAACGFGARYKGRHVGIFGDVGCFSFHPRKAITTGEGGMITTSDESLAQKLRAMRDHGATTSDHQRHQGPKPYLLSDFPYLGFNYRMTDIQASIGCTQMDRASEIHAMRTKWANRYDEFFASIEWLLQPSFSGDYIHGYQAYVCLFCPDSISMKNIEDIHLRRNKFMDYLQGNGVSTRPGTHAVHMLGYYKTKYDLSSEDCPNSWIADRCSLAFPLFPNMTEEEFEYIASLIRKYKP